MLPCHAATVPGCNPEPSRFPSGWALLVVLNARKRPRERAQVLQWLGVFGRYIVPCWSRRASGTSWLDLQEGPTGTEPKQETTWTRSSASALLTSCSYEPPLH